MPSSRLPQPALLRSSPFAPSPLCHTSVSDYSPFSLILPHFMTPPLGSWHAAEHSLSHPLTAHPRNGPPPLSPSPPCALLAPAPHSQASHQSHFHYVSLHHASPLPTDHIAQPSPHPISPFFTMPIMPLLLGRQLSPLTSPSPTPTTLTLNPLRTKPRPLTGLPGRPAACPGHPLSQDSGTHLCRPVVALSFCASCFVLPRHRPSVAPGCGKQRCLLASRQRTPGPVP